MLLESPYKLSPKGANYIFVRWFPKHQFCNCI